MARRPRLFVSDVPYHVVQRGNNKIPIFLADQDYRIFLDTLQEAKTKHPCFIYSYCLMPNHFHLLIEPKEDNNVSLLIKLLGAKYVRYINKNYERSGTLWEGRFKCSLIDKELYFLTCLRYIEMNPVRAGIVNSPELYRWSSYRVRAVGERSFIVDMDHWYDNLGSNAEERQNKYRQFFQNSISDSALQLLREMTNKNGIVGSVNFKTRVEQFVHREIVIRSAGRP
ncbi:MAG: transposase, partial [Candidatus Omnitrophica bacterium]|nr:transposase [Candidatus Omnitrophota bacterium]MBU1928540.1 transposase [Candidatus Omnitrophota bacterium]